jgi:hypothetical protein
VGSDYMALYQEAHAFALIPVLVELGPESNGRWRRGWR